MWHCVILGASDKISLFSKMKSFADAADLTQFALIELVNILEKGETAGYQHFLFFSKINPSFCPHS